MVEPSTPSTRVSLDSGRGTEDLARITYRYLIQISDDNVASPNDHRGDGVLEVSNGSSGDAFGGYGKRYASL